MKSIYSLELEKYPSRALSGRNKRVKNAKTAKHLKERLEYAMMYLCVGQPAGLAAPQIGLRYQACFVREIFMVNPVIINKWGRHDSVEGCYSKRGRSYKVRRWNGVTVIFQDEYLETVQADFEHRMADIVQHEIDHLNGVTIMDKGE